MQQLVFKDSLHLDYGSMLKVSSTSPLWAPGGAAADVDFSFFSVDCGDRGDCEDPWPLGSGVVPVAPLVPCR